VQEIVRGMEHLHATIQQTAQQVHRLDERSQRIHEIIAFMSQIAHRTNRLALDAAVQAAMAGENGKGFQAVAVDIRRLAEHAKEQVDTIAQIIRGVREDIAVVTVSMKETEQETERGTHYTQETGSRLQVIFDLVEQQAEDIQVINAMVREQLSSSSAVVRIMHEVSQSTAQSSQQIRSVAANMDLLAGKAEKLRASVDAFQLKEQSPPRNRATPLLS